MTVEDIVETGADLIEESTEKFLAYATDKFENFYDYKEIVNS